MLPKCFAFVVEWCRENAGYGYAAPNPIMFRAQSAAGR